MTMDFKAYDDAAIAWVQTQIPGVSAQVKNMRGGWRGKVRCRLNFMSSRDLGVDELRYEQDTDLPAGEDFVPTVSGNRQLTLSLLLQSRDQRAECTARWHLEKLRTSLRKPSVKTALRAAGLAYTTAESVVQLDRHVDDRWESQASLDIHFNAVVNERDTDEAGSYVDKASIAATLTAPDGVTDVGWTEETFGNI